MIKRRFYKQEHVDRNDASSSSDSDSDSDSVEDEEEEEIAASENEAKLTSTSSGSGYESGDSSGNEVDCDSSGLAVNDDDESSGKDEQSFANGLQKGRGHVESAATTLSTDVVKASYVKDSSQTELTDECVLKCKSVFKCRLCPRIVCLTEDTLREHLKSKRHARSKKLLNDGRLKLTLNSDGEIEEEQETHAERHARTMALAQDLDQQKTKNKGRQRQRERLKKKKARDASKEGRAKQSMNKASKKRRKM